MRYHISLLGFKHVGKSAIGKALATKLALPFIDLDNQIETVFVAQGNAPLPCRQIMQRQGETVFRALETIALRQVMTAKHAVIALGGGTAMIAENQRLIQASMRVHITAPRGVVFERIIVNGKPAFVQPGEEFIDAFNRLWRERETVHSRIADFAIHNDTTIAQAVNQICQRLKIEAA
jgi:shikimate kinase